MLCLYVYMYVCLCCVSARVTVIIGVKPAFSINLVKFECNVGTKYTCCCNRPLSKHKYIQGGHVKHKTDIQFTCIGDAKTSVAKNTFTREYCRGGSIR